MGKQIHKPKFVSFEVTRRCRYACRHCRAHEGYQENENELTTSQCKKILNSIAEFDKCTIVLTGGEPMERSDIATIIKFGRTVGLKMTMATCGYLINEKSIVKLKEAGLELLSFSLDGATADVHDSFRGAEGSFDSVISAAKLAKKHRIKFQINMNISKINVEEIDGILDLAKELGAECFDAFIIIPAGRDADEILDPVQYETLLNELLRMKMETKRRIHVTCGPQFARICKIAEARGLTEPVKGCIGGREFAFISHSGDVQICGYLGISAGNLIGNHYNFAEIWLGSSFLREIRDTSKFTNCANCEYVGVCGGCRARAYALSGDYMGADPVCDFQQQGNKK